MSADTRDVLQEGRERVDSVYAARGGAGQGGVGQGESTWFLTHALKRAGSGQWHRGEHQV